MANNSPARKGKRIQTSVGSIRLSEVIGYKILRLRRVHHHNKKNFRRPLLTSPLFTGKWKKAGKYLEFKCQCNGRFSLFVLKKHLVPGQIGFCGIYLYKKESENLQSQIRELKQIKYDNVVIAKIAGAGVIVEHEKGYRVQFARIIGLYCTKRFMRQCRKYGPSLPLEGLEL